MYDCQSTSTTLTPTGSQTLFASSMATTLVRTVGCSQVSDCSQVADASTVSDVELAEFVGSARRPWTDRSSNDKTEDDTEGDSRIESGTENEVMSA